MSAIITLQSSLPKLKFVLLVIELLLLSVENLNIVTLPVLFFAILTRMDIKITLMQWVHEVRRTLHNAIYIIRYHGDGNEGLLSWNPTAQLKATQSWFHLWSSKLSNALPQSIATVTELYYDYKLTWITGMWIYSILKPTGTTDKHNNRSIVLNL
jgi:hypothetical protein